MPQPDNSTRARDHLANERTFLAWVRTGLAVVIFGFAIGRFAIAIREFAEAQGHPQRTGGLSVWFGVVAIVTGIVLTFAGLILMVRRWTDRAALAPLCLYQFHLLRMKRTTLQVRIKNWALLIWISNHVFFTISRSHRKKATPTHFCHSIDLLQIS